MYAESTLMGDGLGVSGCGVVCVDESAVASAVPGVRSVLEGGDDAGEDAGTVTRSAGFGNVLYVEPREVYLRGLRQKHGRSYNAYP
jgi:hypothetical protein